MVVPFHLVQRGSLCLARVRQRLAQQPHQHRGRATDPAWAHQMVLLRGYDTLSAPGRERLQTVLTTDDPTGGLGTALNGAEGSTATTSAPQRHHVVLASSHRATAQP